MDIVLNDVVYTRCSAGSSSVMVQSHDLHGWNSADRSHMHSCESRSVKGSDVGAVGFVAVYM